MKRQGRSLRRDDRGAVAMMALFTSAAAIALLGVLGTTIDAVSSRESLQDAADVAAYSGATTMADGLNMTSLVNLTSASLGSLVTAIQSLFLLLMAGTALSQALAPETEGWSLGALGPLAGVMAIAMAFQSGVAEPSKGMIKAGHAAQVALRQQASDVGLHLGGTSAAEQIAGSAVSNFAANTPLPTFNSDPKELFQRGLSYAISQSIPRFRMDYLTEGGSTWEFIVEMALQSGQGLVEQAASLLTGNMAQGNELQVIPEDTKMGGDKFQVRYVVEGPAPNERGIDVARVGGFGQSRPGDGAGSAMAQGKALLQRVGFTQAEAYFEGSEDREDWLFNMGWRSRLRRFQTSPGGAAGGLVQQALGATPNSLIFH